MLSSRGRDCVAEFDIPWRFALGTTYDEEANPEGRISFATAEQALMGKELEEFASRVHIPSSAFTYKATTAGGPRFPAALATHINEFFNPYTPVSGDDIKITAAATPLHEALAFSLAEPGDGILLSRPYYGRFELDFGNRAGVKVVPVNTQVEEAFDEGVVGRYEEAFEKAREEGVRVRAIMVVNPHNPLGRCYPRATLIALMHFCQNHNLHFISDEIYALSVFESGESNINPFSSVLSIDLSGIIDSNLVHVTYGVSKDFGAAGLKLGAIITRNKELKRAILANVRFHGASGAALAIGAAMLEDRAWCRSFIDISRQRIAEAYSFLTSRLTQLGVAYLPGSNAGFFLWVDFGPWLPPVSEVPSDRDREYALAQRFVNEGVFIHPGEEHGLRAGWFRMVFTMKRVLVEEGLRRIERVLKAK